MGNKEGFLKFNDNHVSPADSMEDECFGGARANGVQGQQQAHNNTLHEKNWNAYLLFYERVDGPPDNASGGAAAASAAPAAATSGTTTSSASACASAITVQEDAQDSLGVRKMRTLQSLEVVKGNEDLWRRKLLYQKPVLEVTRQLLQDACGGASSGGAGEEEV